jgi:hypothetical protein
VGAWQKKLDCSRIFGRRVAARPASDEVDSYAIGSCFPRSFQRRWRCRDRSPVAEEPRITAPELWAARPTSYGVDSSAVGSSFSRSFKRLQRCRDRSSVAGEPRLAASLFGDESASWQRRQSDF